MISLGRARGHGELSMLPVRRIAWVVSIQAADPAA
jgi:hypothetical protein